MNQNIKTSLGVAIIIIIAITAGAFTWKAINEGEEAVPVANIQSKKVTAKPIQATDQTADWKTYKNDSLGFEIKYPSAYETHIGDPKLDESEFFIKNPEKDLNPKKLLSLNFYPLSLDVTRNFIGGGENSNITKSPKEWAEGMIKMGASKKETTINGEIAYIEDEDMPEGMKLRYYNAFVKKGNMYDMYSFTIKRDNIGEKILSTFKFTK